MCFDSDSLPPIPAISGAAVSHEDLVLESADGNRFAAFLATPDEPATTGIVILPDVRGLYRFYEELALRFAERGYPALAFDYFGRTAGVEKRGDDFEYMPHVQQTTPEGVQADVAALQVRLDKRKSQLLLVLNLLALLSTLMLAWILYTQIVVIQHHRARMRRLTTKPAPSDEPAPTID